MVADRFPGPPPGLDEPAVIPGPFFLPEPITIDVPGGGHGVDVGVSGLRVDREVDDHAGVDQGLQLHPGVLVPHVARKAFGNGELHLSGKLGVLALFRSLNAIPERGPVPDPRRRVHRSQDLRVDHLGLVESEADPTGLIPEGATRTIGGAGHDGSTVRTTLGSTPNDLDRKMEEAGSEGHGRTLLGCRGA
jgi:hypothetical protein